MAQASEEDGDLAERVGTVIMPDAGVRKTSATKATDNASNAAWSGGDPSCCRLRSDRSRAAPVAPAQVSPVQHRVKAAVVKNGNTPKVFTELLEMAGGRQSA